MADYFAHFATHFGCLGLLWAKEGPNSFVVGLAWDRPGHFGTDPVGFNFEIDGNVQCSAW